MDVYDKIERRLRMEGNPLIHKNGAHYHSAKLLKEPHNTIRNRMRIVIGAYCLLLILVYWLDLKTHNQISAYGMTDYNLVRNGEVRRIFTYSLLHGGIFHILNNLFVIWTIGKWVETFYGHAKTIVLIVGTTLTSGMASIILNNSSTVGASGVGFGLIGATLAVTYAIQQKNLHAVGGVRGYCITFIIYNLVIGLLSPNVDNVCHIGGLIGGYILGMALAADGEIDRKQIKKTHLIIYIVLNVGLCLFLFCGPDIRQDWFGSLLPDFNSIKDSIFQSTMSNIG